MKSALYISPSVQYLLSITINKNPTNVGFDSYPFVFSRFINVVGLGSLNKITGLFFGFVKGMIFMLIIVYILNLTEFRENIIFQESKYLSVFDAIIDKYLTSSSNFFDNIDLKI